MIEFMDLYSRIDERAYFVIFDLEAGDGGHQPIDA